MTRLMLLDSNGLIYRGYHALPPLTTSKGELVNAVFGFCSILLRGIQDVQPEYVAACFDLPGPTFRHEQFADVQGHSGADARRPALAVPEGPRGRGRAADPRLRDGRLRGRRRHRHDHARPGRARHRHDGRDRRPRHAPDRDRAHAADDDAPGRRLHRLLRPGQDLGAVRAAAGPDDRLQGPQGRPDRQHPRHPGSGGEDRGEARRPVRLARGHLRPARRGQARQAAREARRGARAGLRQPRAVAGSSATCRSRSTWRRPGSPTTTGPRWCGSSASSSSGR